MNVEALTQIWVLRPIEAECSVVYAFKFEGKKKIYPLTHVLHFSAVSPEHGCFDGCVSERVAGSESPSGYLSVLGEKAGT